MIVGFVTTRELASLVGVSYSSVIWWIKTGQLSASRAGKVGNYRLAIDSVARFLGVDENKVVKEVGKIREDRLWQRKIRT